MNTKKDEGNDLSYLANLNERQKQAVLKTDGPLLIVAGAGAGKTKTMTHRILHIIKKGVPANKILAITFTNKAAKELKERLFKLIDSDPLLNLPVSRDSEFLPFVSTFHSLGVHILKRFAEHLGVPRFFSIFDRDDSKKAIKEAMERRGIDPKQHDPAKILGIISREKGNGVHIDEFMAFKNESYINSVVSDVWEEYEKILFKEKAFDFDDLLLKSLHLLRKPEIKNELHNTWEYIHIDEYQDTNKVQYEIAKILAEKNRNIAVVGDLDQSIYSWRGADFKNIMRFEKDYPEAEIVLLEENYRSTKTIIAVSNSIIAKNKFRKEKNLFTNNEDGDLLTLYTAIDEKDEADFVTRKMKMLIDQGVPAKEIAVLYRANFQSRALEESLIRKNISYNLLGTKFFERKEVKDTLSFLKFSLNNESLTDFKRAVSAVPRGIGKTTILKIIEGREEDLPKGAKEKLLAFKESIHAIKKSVETKIPSEAMKDVLHYSQIENHLRNGGNEDIERLENVKELVSIAKNYDEIENGMEKFLEHISLSSDQDDLKDEQDAVRLMTVHASKGLEFDYVFVTGLEEGLFPHEGIGNEKQTVEDKEEERRLFYVALTRARKKIYLSYTQLRTIFGSQKVNIPSEFLLDIEDDFLEKENGHGFSGREKIVFFDF